MISALRLRSRTDTRSCVIGDTRGEAPRGTEQGAAWVAERRAADADSTPTLYTTLHGADQAATAGGNDPCHEPAAWPQAFKIDGANDATKQREESRNWDSTKRDTRRRTAQPRPALDDCGRGRRDCRDGRDDRRDVRLAWRRARAWAGHDVRWPARNNGRDVGSGSHGQARRCDGRLAAGGCRCHCRATRQNRGHLQRRDQRSGADAFATHAGAQGVAAIADAADDRSRPGRAVARAADADG